MISAVARGYKELYDKIDALARRSPLQSAVVTAVDIPNSSMTLNIDGLGEQVVPVTAALGYVPFPGSHVKMLMNGTDPIVLPPPGTMAPGNAMHSADYLTGISGWAIDAEGDAEFNNIFARGRIEGIDGPDVARNGQFEQAAHPNLLPNGDFEIDTLGWSPTDCALTSSTAQARIGTHSMRMAASGGDMVARTPGGVSGVPVLPDRQYMFFISALADTSARFFTLGIAFYDFDGNQVGNERLSSFVNLTSGWTDWLVNAVSPPYAYYARVSIRIIGCAAAEIHYVDAGVFRLGPEGWTIDGANTWMFDGGVDGWTGITNCAVFHVTVDSVAGVGSLLVAASGPGDIEAGSPDGIFAVPLMPYSLHTATAFVRPLTNSRTASAVVRWYNAAGTFISEDVQAPVLLPFGEWTAINIDLVTAPSTATFGAVSVRMQGCVTNDWFLVDTVVLTMDPNVAIVENVDPAYVYTGSRSLLMRLLDNGVGVVQSPDGNFSGLNAQPVSPDEWWHMSIRYRNWLGNTTRRNLALIAAWYDIAGNFIGPEIGDWNSHDPGSGWVTLSDTFHAPPNAYYLRVNVATLGTQGDILYLDDFQMFRSTTITGKIIPRGEIKNVEQAVIDITDAQIVFPTVWQTLHVERLSNPGQSIRLKVGASGNWRFDDTIAQNLLRVGVSLDGGSNFFYSKTPKTNIISSGHGIFDQVEIPVHAAWCQRIMPTQEVVIQVQGLTSASGGDTYFENGVLEYTMIPAG